MSADAYTKNLKARGDKIKAKTLIADKEIKTKGDRLVKALEDLKNKNIGLKHEPKELVVLFYLVDVLKHLNVSSSFKLHFD